MTDRSPTPNTDGLPLTPTELPDSSWIDAAWARVQSCGVLAITGAALSDASGAAQAVAGRAGRPVLRVRLWGAQDEADILRALGEALELAVCGDFSAIAAALARASDTLLLLEDADLPELPQVLDALSGAGGRACTLLTCRVAPPGIEAMVLPDSARNPEPLPSDRRSWALAWAPTGLPAAGGPPSQRVALSRGVAEALHGRITAPEAATLLAREVPGLLAVARGAPAPELSPFADGVLLRFLAREHPEPDLAAAAAAAGARLLAAAGQLPLARELLSAAAQREISTEGEALIRWSEGDILLAYGLLIDATDHHRAAARVLPAAVLNGSGALLAERGQVNEARRRFKEARAVASRAGDALRAADALRGLAEVAVSAGEAMSADALYEEAGLSLANSEIGRANLAVGNASLAIARGESSSAERLLEEAERLAGGVPLLNAALLRRRAELRLRQGRHPEARALLERVVWMLQRQGHRAAAASAMRLLGDVAAAARRPREAVERYEQALQEAARVGDLVGARRTLVHLLEVERIGGDGGRVEELLGLLAEVDTELGDPEREDGVRMG